MAGVRDPQFWRRFSMAVHLDEEKATIGDHVSTSTSSSKPHLKHADSWIERHHKKKRKTRVCGWFIALGFVLFICAVVFVLLWYTKSPPFKNI